MSDLDKTLAIIGTINQLVPAVTSLVHAVQGLFASQTASLTNEERIALLRQAGIATVAEADAWLQAHPPA
jgi:hypothetical protein